MSSLFEQKQIKAQTLAADKAAILSNRTVLKQNQHDPAAVANNIDRMVKELATLQQDETITNVDYTLPESLVERVQRGGAEAVEGTLNLRHGIVAGGAAVVENIVGEGGIATKVKKAAVDKFTQSQEDMAYYSRPEDSFVHSYNKAKEGDYNAMLNWAAHGTGYISAQLATILSGAGIINIGTRVIGKKTISKIMKTMVDNEAKRLIKDTTKKATEKEILTQATKNVTAVVGNRLGMGSVSFGLEGGEIMGTLAQQTLEGEKNRVLTKEEIFKGLTATGLAGAVEYLELALGLKALKGTLGGIPGTKVVEGIGGVKGKVARTAVSSAKISPLENIQEQVQTGLEQWGIGDDPFTATAREEQIDAGMIGALSFIPTAIGPLTSKSTNENREAQKKKANKQKAAQIKQVRAHPKYKEKVSEIIEKGNVEKFTDVSQKDYNPIIAADVYQELNKQDIPLNEKIKNHNDAIKVFTDIGEHKALIISRMEELLEQSKTDENFGEKEHTELKDLENNLDMFTDIEEQIEPVIKSMRNIQEDDPELIKQVQKIIKENKPTQIQGAILNSFGSKSIKSDDISLDDIITNKNTDAQTKNQAKILQQYLQDENELVKNQSAGQVGKTAAEVNIDILDGNVAAGFKGIKTYKRNIAEAIKANNIELAQKEMTGLKAFADQHNLKAKLFRRVQAATLAGKTVSEADQTAMLPHDIALRNSSLGRYQKYTFGPKFERTVTSMELEAKTLRSAVNAAQSFIKQPAKPNTESSVQEQEKSIADAVLTESASGISDESGQKGSTEKTYNFKPDKVLQKMSAKELAKEGLKYIQDTSNAADWYTKKVKALITKINKKPGIQKTSTPKTTKPLQNEKIKNTNIEEEKDRPLKVIQRHFSRQKIPFDSDVSTIKITSLVNEKQDKALKNIAKAFGVELHFYETTSKIINKNGGVAVWSEENFVFINKNSKESYMGILGHEITHQLKQQFPDLYKKLDDHLLVNSEQFEAFKTKLLANVKGTPAEQEYSKTARDELIAMFVGENFDKKSFWEAILNEDPTLFDKLAQIALKIINKALAAVPSVQGYFSNLRNAKLTLTYVIKEAAKRVAAQKTEVKPAKQNPEVSTHVETEPSKQYKVTPLRELITGGENSLFEPTGQKAGIANKTYNIEDAFEKIQKSEKLPADKQAMLNSLITFNDNFKEVFLKRFLVKSKGYEDQSPINYFLVDGKIPDNLITVMAGTAYKWLAASGQSTIFNDERSLRGILGLPASANIIPDAYDKLGTVGNTSRYLGEQLGRELLSLLQIKPTKGTVANLGNRTELSLGFAMLGVLQDMGYVKRTHVLQTSFDSLKSNNQNKRHTAATTATASIDIGKGKKKSVPAFNVSQRDVLQFKLHTNRFFAVQSNKKTEAVHTAVGETKGFWEQIFELPPNIQEYSLTKPSFKNSPKQWRKGRSDEVATIAETNRLKHSIEQPYEMSQTLFNVLDLFSQEQQETLWGAVALTGVSASQLKGLISKNNSIKRSMKHVEHLLHNLKKQKTGYETQFYINAQFENTGRMHQTGTIKPQGDKAHRVLFPMSSWVQTINTHSPVQRDKFKEAVGQAFGLEVSKTYGLKAVLVELDEFIIQPDIQAALAIIDKPSLSAAEQVIIMEAVKMGGENLASLKGLIEYQKYQVARKTGATFTTDISIERDGIANGPTTATIQLNSLNINSEILGRLTSQGLIFNPKFYEKDHMAAHDPYEAIGAYWGTYIIQQRAELIKSGDKVDLNDVKQLDAINNLLQKFTDEEGYLADGMRKLAKGGAVGALYGAGETSIIEDFVEDILISGVEDYLMTINKMEKSDNKKQIFDYLNQTLAQATGLQQSQIWQNLTDNKDTLLNISITPLALDRLIKNASKLQGAALVKAITNIYGSIRENSTTLNHGITILAAKYNAVLEYKVAAWVKENDTRITNTALDQIKDEIKELLPRVQTPDGGMLGLYDFISSPFQETTPEDLVQHNFAQDFPTRFSKTGGFKMPDNHLEVIRGYPNKISILKNPGVKPIITMTHMLDSIVANNILGYKRKLKNGIPIGILNVHDAGISSIDGATSMANLQNKVYQEIMQDYSMSAEIQKSIINTNKTFDVLTKDLNLTKELTSSFKNMKLLRKDTDTVNQIEQASASEIIKVVDDTNTNKNIIMNNNTFMNQYYNPRGGKKTKNSVATEINGIKVEDIIPVAVIRKEVIAAENLKLMREGGESLGNTIKEEIEQKNLIGSGPRQTISLDPADYATIEEINKQNVLETYNIIKDNSTISDGAQHDQYLQNILSNLIQNVLQPIDMHMQDDATIEPEGIFQDIDNTPNKIFMSNQTNSTTPISGALSHGLRMSSGEVYVHELLHAVLHSGLKLNTSLRHKVSVLYNLAYKHFGAEGYKVFLNDPTINVNDPAYKYEVAAAKERYDYIFGSPDLQDKTKTNKYTGIKNQHQISNYLDEFITLGLSNENFIKALQKIKLDQTEYAKSSWAGIKGDTIQATLINIGQKIMNMFYMKFGTQKQSFTVAEELYNLAYTIAQIDSQHKGAIFSSISKVDKAYTQVGKVANKHIKNVFKKGVLKPIHNIHALLQAAKEKDTKIGQMLRVPLYAFQRLDYGIIKSTITEVMGETERLAAFHSLLNRRKIWLDMAKENEIAAVTKGAKEIFSHELTDDVKVSLTRAGLNTDSSILLQHMSIQDLAEIMTNNTKLYQEIDNILNQIKSDKLLAPYLDYYQQASDALGHFMVHTQARSYEVPFLNVNVIAELLNTKHEGKLTDDTAISKAVTLIDQLASLYAIKNVPEAQKTLLADLITTNGSEVEDFFHLHSILKDSAKENNFDNNKYLFEKGYTKDILNQRIQFQFGTLAEQQELEAAGFSRSEKAIQRDQHDPTTENENIYIYISRTGRVNNLQSTTASYTGQRAKGTNSRHIAQQLDLSTKIGRTNNNKIIGRKLGVLNAMTKPLINPVEVPGSYMIPQVDRTGHIVNYRYMMSEVNKVNYLEKVNNYDVILGAMAGQIIDKVRTPGLNVELIDALKKIYDNEYQDEPGAYVEVGPNSTDPELQEIYFLLPEATKQYIQKKWGGPTMYVAKDILAISFGYRQYSIVDAFSMDQADRAYAEKIVVGLFNMIANFTPTSGVKLANSTENVMIELTKLAKNNIIVKSLLVTLNNLGSNFWYLRSRGVSTSNIVRIGWEAVRFGTKYQDDMNNLNQAKIKYKILKNKGLLTQAQKQDYRKLRLQIMQLEDAITRNPTTEAIESGLLPSLVDDVETTVEGHSFPSPFEKKVTELSNKLYPPIKNVGKVLFLTQDTQSYKVLNNAVKMTDFIGRYILLKHYIAKERGAEQINMEQAVPKVIEEFVNFNLPTHRMVEYFNSIGIFWFTKYGLRILKSIKNAAVDKPFEVMMALFMSTRLGMDNINNSIPGVTQGVFTKLGDPVTSYIGAWDEPITLNILDGDL